MRGRVAQWRHLARAGLPVRARTSTALRHRADRPAGRPAAHRAPSAYPLGAQERVRLADLAGEHWIQGVRHGPTLEVLPRACREAGFEPIIALRTDDRTVVEALVAAGVGVALIPHLTLATVREDVIVRPLDSAALFRKVRIALPPGSHRPPATLAMLDVLREVGDKVKTTAIHRLGGR